MTIFVSIAAFCEPLLEFTLDGLFSKARNPSLINIGLVDQSLDNNREWLEKKNYWPNISYVQIHPIDARGVSWARSIVFSLYRGEDHVLQIDSHTHFDQDWDEHLLNSLNQLPPLAEKPILTTYPPPFDFDEANQPYPTLKPSDTIYALRKHPETELTEKSATLRFRVEHLRGAHYAEGFHIAAGFFFTLGSFVEEIPYDPYMYFHGEEQNLAIRAYTHGWTIFHPQQNAIPIYHLYKQRGNSYSSHHWHPDYEAQRQVKWTTLKRQSDIRLIRLVGGNLTGSFSLGNERTLMQFIEISSINYAIYKKNPA
jgi:hypothetical protein